MSNQVFVNNETIISNSTDKNTKLNPSSIVFNYNLDTSAKLFTINENGVSDGTNTTALNKLCSVGTDIQTINTNISTLETTTSTNSTDIGNLETSINTNTTNISTLQTDLSNLEIVVNTNTTEISTLETSVNTNTTNISTLQTDLTTLSNSVATNSADITTLQADVEAIVIDEATILDLANKTQALLTPSSASTLEVQNKVKLVSGANTATLSISGANTDLTTTGEIVLNPNSIVSLNSKNLTSINRIIPSSGLKIGTGTGITSQSANGIAIGTNAGYTNQLSGVAIGNSAGYFYQDDGGVAIGTNAGYSVQGTSSVAIGNGAGNDTQGDNSVAIGNGAGNSIQGLNGTSIGNNAGNTNQGQYSVAVGSGTGQINQGEFSTSMGFQAGYTGQGGQTTAVGSSAGKTNQGSNSTAVGLFAGNDTQGIYGVAVGSFSGQTIQGDYSVAIGNNAGKTNQSTYGVAIGGESGKTYQGSASVAVGSNAGNFYQDDYSVAIGFEAGNTSQGIGSVGIGTSAGSNTQGASSVAVGSGAGETTQGDYCIAIGDLAGSSNQGNGLNPAKSVAIGSSAGQINQGAQAIAIGRNAGNTGQGINAIAIGNASGETNQGANSIAIGSTAGTTNQHSNTIVISANISGITTGGTNRTYIAPIRGRNLGLVNGTLWYDISTRELIYSDNTLASGARISNSDVVENDISTLQTDVLALQTDVGTLQTDVGTIQTDISINSDDITNLKTTTTTNTSTISSIQSNITSIQSINTFQSSQISTLQTQTAVDKSLLQGQINSINSTISTIESDIDLLMVDVVDNTTNIGTLQTDLTNLETAVNNISNSRTEDINQSITYTQATNVLNYTYDEKNIYITTLDDNQVMTLNMTIDTPANYKCYIQTLIIDALEFKGYVNTLTINTESVEIKFKDGDNNINLAPIAGYSKIIQTLNMTRFNDEWFCMSDIKLYYNSVSNTTYDNTPPVITLTGSNNITIEINSGNWSELGYSAEDNIDGDITANVVVAGDIVDTTTLGVYVITYNVVDAKGNEAIQKTRTINVIDTTNPVITLNGSSSIEITTADISYTEDGATATDNSLETINVVIDATDIEYGIAGDYLIYYTATDSSQNTTTITRTLTIVSAGIQLVYQNDTTDILTLFNPYSFITPSTSSTDYEVNITGNANNWCNGAFRLSYSLQNANYIGAYVLTSSTGLWTDYRDTGTCYTSFIDGGKTLTCPADRYQYAGSGLGGGYQGSTFPEGYVYFSTAINSVNYDGNWIRYSFPFLVDLKSVEFLVGSTNGNVGIGWIFGSNDISSNDNYVLLATINATATASYVASVNSNSVAYKHFLIIINQTTGGSYLRFSYIRFLSNGIYTD